MQHLTIGVFGDAALAKKMGKQGTTNDILLTHHADSERIWTFASPNSPEIKPLLQVVQLIDVPVVAADAVTRELAEQLVALDAFGFGRGFILSQNEQLRQLIKGTTLERYTWVRDERELREQLTSVPAAATEGSVWIPIDNSFSVKSVGTVVLGVVRSGTVKKHDTLAVQPLGAQAVVKGIQSQDKDVDAAHAGMRVGLSLKGVDASDLKRGYVLCANAHVAQHASVMFTKSRFSRETPTTGGQLLLSVGLQVIACRIESADPLLTLSLDQPAAWYAEQQCLLASTKQTLPRILGAGAMFVPG